MCGIVAYVGTNPAFPLIIEGLKRLEYRGYDSAGIATVEPNGDLVLNKKKGKVSDLLSHINGDNPVGTIGIGHTRWATHGPPNDVNAHPHRGASNRIAIIHNGIIENFAAIKESLKCRGHNLQSDTDSEVLAHLIEEVMDTSSLDLFDAVRAALSQVVGAYALVVIDRENPERLIAARKSSPLVIGIGEDGAYYVASDATPIVSHTKNVVYLEDEEVANLDLSNGLKIHTISNDIITPEVHALEIELESIEKGGYERYAKRNL